MRKIILTLALLTAGFVVAAETRTVGLNPEKLRCEYRSNPLGTEAQKPRLSWILQSEKRDQVQSAYQILAASTLENLSKDLADLWDSGKVSSDQTLHIYYGGKPLHSGQRVYWKVRVWDGQNNSSPYSATAWWEMGLLGTQEWKAKWITRASIPLSDEEMFNDNPSPLFRKEFKIDKKIARARAYVSGLGYYEFYLNGQKVGDHVLDPGWTTYSKRVLYSTYDVTSQLKKGRNAFGLMVGNGWYNPLPLPMWGKINPRQHLTIGEPCAILQVAVEFKDGTSEVFCTDQTWKVGKSPILRNSVYLGEVYDARKELKNWSMAGFNDSKWENAIISDKSLGPLRSQSAPPIRITRTIKPVKISEPKPGVYIFDMGQNFAGVARLRVKAPEGTRVRLRYGELLYPDGTLNGMTAVCGQLKAGGAQYIYDGVGKPKTAFQIDEYVCKGKGEEVFTPRFTFHGFRYVEVTGLKQAPGLNSLEGLRINSDVESVGSFSCSNDMFNQLQDAVLWTELSNLFSVQSDCPHREKFGYGGDIIVSGEMGMFNFGMESFYEKAALDLADAARPNGGFTETAPYVGIADQGLGENSGPVEWASAHPWLVWHLYQYYGNEQLMAEQYDAVKKWLQLLLIRSPGGILDNGLSDHETIAPKARALTGTAFFYWNAELARRMAAVLGKTNDVARADATLNGIAAAFERSFMRNNGKYDTGTQACQSFALYMGLVPRARELGVLDSLVQDIVEHDYHLTTGIFGTKFMLNALTDRDFGDVAYAVVNQRTFPGWGHMLANGATTLWEHWEYSDNTYSHNHPMFGSVSEWFYKSIGGINPATNAVGFNRIVIRPQPSGDLKWAKTSYESVRGKIATEWKKESGAFTLTVTIPPNTSALIQVPTDSVESVAEGGQAVRSIGFPVQVKSGAVVCSVGSGTYRFSSALK